MTEEQIPEQGDDITGTEEELTPQKISHTPQQSSKKVWIETKKKKGRK